MASVGTDTIPTLVMGIGSSLCALPLTHVVETMRPLDTEPVRGCPDYVIGVSVVRGEPIPVIHLATLVGERTVEIRRFITLRVGGRTMALAVEHVVGVRTLECASLAEAPLLIRALRPSVVSQLGLLDNALLMILDTGRLWPEELRMEGVPTPTVLGDATS